MRGLLDRGGSRRGFGRGTVWIREHELAVGIIITLRLGVRAMNSCVIPLVVYFLVFVFAMSTI